MAVGFAYSPRGLRLHPYRWPEFMPLPERLRLYQWLRESGFDGIEVEDVWLDFAAMAAAEVAALRRELDGEGIAPAGFKVPEASVVHPAVALQNRERLRRGVELAAALGTRVVTFSLSAVPQVLGRATHQDLIGRRDSPGSSAAASEADFAETARVLVGIADQAAPLGVELSVEVHQNSLADHSRSTLRLLELIGRPNVGVNPDLGNVFWHYAEPEESPDEAIVRLAPRGNYWHVKNVRRVYFAELDRAIFQRTPVPEGEIDYRWAVDVLVGAGFSGWVVIEGTSVGDQLEYAQRGLTYIRRLFDQHRAEGAP